MYTTHQRERDTEFSKTVSAYARPLKREEIAQQSLTTELNKIATNRVSELIAKAANIHHRLDLNNQILAYTLAMMNEDGRIDFKKNKKLFKQLYDNLAKTSKSSKINEFLNPRLKAELYRYSILILLSNRQ